MDEFGYFKLTKLDTLVENAKLKDKDAVSLLLQKWL